MQDTNTKKIKVVIPVVTTQFNEGIKEEVEAVVAPDFAVDYENLSVGTDFIESRYAEFLDTADIIRISREAEKQGFDGIFVDCFGSPGVAVVRELVRIPVLGGFDGAVLAALSISQRFSIISVVPSVIPMLWSLARDLGVDKNISSIRVVNIEVDDLTNTTKLTAALIRESLTAIEQDGAEAIVLGCTGMLGVVREVTKALEQLDEPVPVVAPTGTAIGHLQSLIRNQLSQSRLTYHDANGVVVVKRQDP